MCFSASASFTASAGLAVIGGVSLKKTTLRSHYLLASIPLLFGIQQGIEGLLWMAFNHGLFREYISALSLAYGFFAFCLWPVYVPLAVFVIERQYWRRVVMCALLFLGVGISLWLSYYVYLQPFSVGVLNESLHYRIELTGAEAKACLIAYVLVVFAAPFFSRQRYIRLFGCALLASAAVSFYFYLFAAYSVWCFFAAILSGVIFFEVSRQQSDTPYVK